MKKILNNSMYLTFSIITIILYIKFSIIGFRWPSSWVMTNHLITGMIPRAFVGNIISLFLGVRLYKKTTLYTIILSISLIFIIYIIYNIVKLGLKNKSLLCLGILFVFVTSPYSKYFLHEAGYFEQYGYIFGIILIEVALRKGTKLTLVMSFIFSLISVLICETNLFLVIPFLYSISIIKIFEEKINIKKRVLIFSICFLPIVLYSLLSFHILQPTSNYMNNLYKNNQKYVDFDVRKDVYYYAWADRSNKQIWGRTLHPIAPQCIIYPLILIFIISFFLCKIGHKKIAIVYSILSILVGIFNYSIVIVAWDIDRYYFCIFMQIFIISLYIIRKFLSNYHPKGMEFIPLLMFLIISIFLSDYEFYLFDNAKYLKNMNDVFKEVSNP